MSRPYKCSGDQKNFGFSFLKTGYRGIYAAIAADFATYGVYTVQAKEIVFAGEVIDFMYRNSKHEPFYSVMKSHLTQASFVAIALESNTDVPCQAIVHGLKTGASGYENLRQKYHQTDDIVSDESFDMWRREAHPRQDELTVTLTQRNVFHASDDALEAHQTLEMLARYNPEFFNPRESIQSSATLGQLACKYMR